MSLVILSGEAFQDSHGSNGKPCLSELALLCFPTPKKGSQMKNTCRYFIAPSSRLRCSSYAAMYIATCTQPHIHAQPHTHAHSHTYMHSHTHSHTHMHTATHTRTATHTHTHTHMHTTTRTQPHTHCQTCIDNKSAKISSPHAVSISSPHAVSISSPPIAIFNIG